MRRRHRPYTQITERLMGSHTSDYTIFKEPFKCKDNSEHKVLKGFKKCMYSDL